MCGLRRPLRLRLGRPVERPAPEYYTLMQISVRHDFCLPIREHKHAGASNFFVIQFSRRRLCRRFACATLRINDRACVCVYTTLYTIRSARNMTAVISARFGMSMRACARGFSEPDCVQRRTKLLPTPKLLQPLHIARACIAQGQRHIGERAAECTFTFTFTT